MNKKMIMISIIIFSLLCSSCKTTSESTDSLPISSILGDAFDTDFRKGSAITCNQTISISSSEGMLYGLIAYEVPILSPSLNPAICQATVDEINNFFRLEKDRFFSSQGVSVVIDRAYECVASGLFPIPLFSATVLTEIVQCENDIFSVRQLEHWFSGGTNNDYEHGLTFSLTTGKRLYISDFISLPLEDFTSKLVDYLYDKLCTEEIVCTKDELQKAYSYSSYEEYSFFIEDDMLYVILPAQSTSGLDKIVCWSLEQLEPVQFVYGRVLQFDADGSYDILDPNS